MRFEPDTLRDALLRPLAMAAPDAHVYVEIMAPDLRFLFVAVLLAWLAAASLMRRARGDRPPLQVQQEPRSAKPALVLVAVLALAFVPWLTTTGNGRYFAAALLVAGPACVGLAWLLPGTRGLRLALVLLIVGLQGFVVQQAAPWRAWTLVSWRDAPYLKLDLPTEMRTEPVTVVTMSAISYSVLAPIFHPQSRWISLHNAPAPSSGSLDARRTEAFLSDSPGRVLLLVPVVRGMMTAARLPNSEVAAAIEAQLAPYGLRFARPQSCRFLGSPALADAALGMQSADDRGRSGFWLCDLLRLNGPPEGPPAHGRRYDAVFRVLEAQCPRLLPAGGDGASLAIRDGEVRSYLRAEMKVYVYDSGEVLYKYYRALNPVPVGSVADLLAGRVRLDCGSIRGRSGLPWERGI